MGIFQLDITKIHLTPFLKAIIQTPLFQRLKDIHQLGLSLVFPNVNHSRYDHCIGTYYLADKMMHHLEVNSKIEIPQLYRECVQVAGLLHDIGHGPWSHLWEQINGVRMHESNCKICIDKIFEDENVKGNASNEFELHFEFAIKFIKSLITGEQLNSSEHKDLKKFKFLYEIIHNEHRDIDVDRWDYIKRDLYNAKTGGVIYPEFNSNSIVVDFEDLFTGATISGEHIEYNRGLQAEENLKNFFDARQRLHVQLYSHPITNLFQHLLARAIKQTDDIEVKLPKFNGKLMKDVNFDSKTFNIDELIYLTDKYIFEQLQKSEDQKVKSLISFMEKSRKDPTFLETIMNSKIAEIDVKGYSASDINKKIQEYDKEQYAVIEFKVKSTVERARQHNVYIEDPENNLQHAIHQLHIFDLEKLLL